MTELITAAEQDELILALFGRPLEAKGFIRTGKRRWVRSRVAEIREVFEFVSLRHSLNPRWGFSLDYCPTIRGDSLKWHRTEKGAHIDVFHDPIDYVDPGSPEFHGWLLSCVVPKREAQKRAETLSNRALTAALEWFGKVNGLASLLDLLQAKQSEQAVRFRFKNYVQQPLALLLACARVGDIPTARSLLEAYVKDYRVSPAAAGKLACLLEY